MALRLVGNKTTEIAIRAITFGKWTTTTKKNNKKNIHNGKLK